MADAATPVLYASDALLGAWPGVAVFRMEAADGALVPIVYAPTGSAFLFYGVSAVVQQGTWFLPTVAQSRVPSAWMSNAFGGISNLDASGPGVWTSDSSGRVMRPAQALWWIPGAALGPDGSVSPAIVNGTVSGTFPTAAPGATPTQPPQAPLSASPWPWRLEAR